jgi:hypothetical protein
MHGCQKGRRQSYPKLADEDTKHANRRPNGQGEERRGERARKLERRGEERIKKGCVRKARRYVMVGRRRLIKKRASPFHTPAHPGPLPWALRNRTCRYDPMTVAVPTTRNAVSDKRPSRPWSIIDNKCLPTPSGARRHTSSATMSLNKNNTTLLSTQYDTSIYLIFLRKLIYYKVQLH